MFNKIVWSYYKKLAEIDKNFRKDLKLDGDVTAIYKSDSDSLNALAKAFLGDDVVLTRKEPTEEEITVFRLMLNNYCTNEVQLNEAQIRSIVSALSNDITIVRGFVGTGKTLLVKTAMEYLNQKEPEAKVAAISYRADFSKLYTILGSEISEYDYLFIDGAERFSNFEGLAALSKAKHVILLGDNQQLPPYRPHEFYDEDILIDIPGVYCDTGNRNFMRTCLNVFQNNCYMVCLDENYTNHPALVDFMNECYGSNTYVKGMMEDDGKLPIRVRWYSGDDTIWYKHQTMGVSRLYTKDCNQKQNNIFIKDELPEILEILKNNPDYSICVVSTLKSQLLELKEDICNALGDSVDILENIIEPTIPGAPFAFKLVLNGHGKKLFDRVYYLTIHDYGRKPFSQKLEVINHVVSLAKRELCLIISLNWLPSEIQKASNRSFNKMFMNYHEILGCLMERVHDMIEKDGRIVDQGFGFVEDTLMNTSNLTSVYVLSKEGDAYTDGAYKNVFNMIKTEFEHDAEMDAFRFFSGAAYNESDRLLSIIKANMNCYVAISYFDKAKNDSVIAVIPPSDMQSVVACLEFGIPSWEAIMVCLDEEDNIEWLA